MEPKWVYRLEATTPGHGLWYDGEGKWVWDLGKLENCKTKDLPMSYDERYKKDSKDWFSSCSRKEDLTHWYSKEDALKLVAEGFAFTKYLATEYVEYELETTFIKETALERIELPVEEFFA